MKRTSTIVALLLVLSTSIAEASALLIGPTERIDAKIMEKAAIDKAQPSTTLASLNVASSGEYAFVKIDLSKLPPLDQIFIVEAYLGFHIDSWSGSGAGGYASVATHFCKDNSWSASTLTWNNRPEIRAEWTDTWGFSFIYFGSSLGFNIEKDVEEALNTGSMMLTEVITWGSGSGHCSLSGGYMDIEYARRPVYKLSIDAVSDMPEINISKTKIAEIKISNQLLTGGETGFPEAYAVAGTYDLIFSGRCKFLGWEAEGGASVLSKDELSTKLTVSSDAKLKARCSLNWVLYGEPFGVKPTGSVYVRFNASQRYAEKQVPVVTGYIRLLRLYVLEDPVPFELHILGKTSDPTKTQPQDIATPVRVNPSGKGWVELDLTSQQIKLEKDAPFYISVTWLQDNKPSLAKYLAGGYGDTFEFTGGSWQTSSQNAMIQLLVSRALDERVSFPYSAKVTISGVPPVYFTKVYIDGAYSDSLRSNGSLTFQFTEKPVTISVDQYVTGPTGTRYFCSSNSWTVSSDDSQDFDFVTQYFLSVSSPHGKTQGEGWYDEGSVAKFSVNSSVPAPDILGGIGAQYIFDHWSGDSTAETAGASVAMFSPKSVTAFWRADYTPLYLIGGIAIVVTGAIILFVFQVRRRPRQPGPEPGPTLPPPPRQSP